LKSRILIYLMTGLLRVFALLPYGVLARLGTGIGALLYRIPSTRRRVVHTNLKLCFPDMSEAERERLARAHFCHVIRSYVERGPQWFGNAQAISRLVEVERARSTWQKRMHGRPFLSAFTSWGSRPAA
jgi:KDO2-lipid IV(A) lauroyltransferase